MSNFVQDMIKRKINYWYDNEFDSVLKMDLSVLETSHSDLKI